jgi:hypothetical protein
VSAAGGLRVLARSAWPGSAGQAAVPELPGFVVSSFSAVAAEVGGRCMQSRPVPGPGDGAVTAVVIASTLGDVASAEHVADAVDRGARVGPLLFFQSVPNAVAGHLAARWGLTGPVVSVGAMDSALEVAALLIGDGDADQALVIRVDQDDAQAVLLAAAAPATLEER